MKFICPHCKNHMNGKILHCVGLIVNSFKLIYDPYDDYPQSLFYAYCTKCNDHIKKEQEKINSKELLKAGYNHIFVRIGGGCGLCGDSKYPCDDEYECVICGIKITLLSKTEGHFEMPTIFYGRSMCRKENKGIKVNLPTYIKKEQGENDIL